MRQDGIQHMMSQVSCDSLTRASKFYMVSSTTGEGSFSSRASAPPCKETLRARIFYPGVIFLLWSELDGIIMLAWILDTTDDVTVLFASCIFIKVVGARYVKILE
jgi:hypothetical protein